MKQSEIFLTGEGRAWTERNKHKLPPAIDPVLNAIKTVGLDPDNLLEIGCGNGWRLAALEEAIPGTRAYGIDPAVTDQRDPQVVYGTANRLPNNWTEQFDLVIYGFCLYLTDREDLFRIASEGDRILADGGHLIVHDFAPEKPCSRPYEHRNGVTSYKMDYSLLWLGNPAYRIVYSSVDGTNSDATSVTILKKDLQAAWPPEAHV